MIEILSSLDNIASEPAACNGNGEADKLFEYQFPIHDSCLFLNISEIFLM